MSARFNDRIKRIEEQLGVTDCPQCFGHPTQIEYVDPETDERWYALFPNDVCDTCGREMKSVLQIIIEQGEEVEEL